MDSYHELAFMDTSIKLLKVREELTQLQVQKKKLQMKIDAKLQEEAELSMRSSRFLKIISCTKGKDHYSPQKRGVFPPTPKKDCNIIPASPIPGKSTPSQKTNSQPSPLGSIHQQMKVAEARQILNKHKSTPPSKLDIDNFDGGINDDELLSVLEHVEESTNEDRNKSDDEEISYKDALKYLKSDEDNNGDDVNGTSELNDVSDVNKKNNQKRKMSANEDSERPDAAESDLDEQKKTKREKSELDSFNQMLFQRD